MLFGYSATLLPELLKPDSEIHITPELASWIASAVPLLISIGCLTCGPIMERYGRKTAHFILCIPYFFSWILIYGAPNLFVLLSGRILGGFGAGLLGTLFPAYLGEVTEPKYRGFFLATPSMALAFGILVTHLIGTFLSWRTTALIASSIPLMTAVMLLFVPETPSWLVSKNRFNDALDSFTWLRGNNAKAREEFNEMWEKHKQAENNRKFDETSKIMSAFKKPEFVKPFLIVLCCFFTMQFSGPYTVVFYSVLILEKTLHSEVNEYLIMNMIDILRLVMVIVASGLLRVCARRVLMLTSGIGTVISALTLSAFLYFFPKSEYTWIPIGALAAYMVFVSIGIFVLPWCMAGELLPLEYRSLGTSLNVSINFFLFFVVIKIAPSVIGNFGIHGAFLSFACICMMGTITLFFVLPETKNRTLVDIEKDFSTSCKKKNNNNEESCPL